MLTLVPTPGSPLPAAPGPADLRPAATLGHYFFFPSLGRGVLGVPPTATAEATLTAGALVLRLRGGLDYLRFELPEVRLPDSIAWPAAWPAAYALRSPAHPLAPASVAYQHGRFINDGLVPCLLPLSELAAQLTGSLTLTAYDAGRQLLSGYFEVRAPGQPDPTREAAPGTPCTILLAGDFAHVQLRTAR